MNAPVYWISAQRLADQLPPPDQALSEPDGLLAVGGDLSPERLLHAYRRGIFPWYGEDQPILWWSPDPRAVLFPTRLNVSRSLRRTLRRGHFEVTFDTDFGAVIEACAAPRARQSGTWLTRDMRDAYCALAARGVAHSVECWEAGALVGGVYGVELGRVFFGESMFSRRTDASKVALVHLVGLLLQRGCELIDCQVQSTHLASLGAETLPRAQFLALLDRWCDIDAQQPPWPRSITP